VISQIKMAPVVTLFFICPPRQFRYERLMFSTFALDGKLVKEEWTHAYWDQVENQSLSLPAISPATARCIRPFVAVAFRRARGR
jgi:hypothetical protein